MQTADSADQVVGEIPLALGVVQGVRILVADDHEVVRQGVRALLEAVPGWSVCAEAATGADAVARARELRPDLAIVDIGMPGTNGLAVARRIAVAAPATQVLFLTLHESDQTIREVLATGARGCVFESDAGRDLVAGVRALLAGRQFFASRVSEVVAQEYVARTPRGGQRSASDRLTPRERQVLRLAAQGRANKEIAAALGIRLKTVETHRANLMRKLGLHSVGDSVRYAVRHGLIEP